MKDLSVRELFEWIVLKHFALVDEQFELLFSVIWVRMTARSKLAILASM
jgi:hypothetical protein